MRTISLKLPDELIEASGRLAADLRVSRAEYIRQAIEQKNRQTSAGFRARRIAEASRRVRKESMRVNAEFAAVEGAPDA
ncbi:MAG: ribbon-helix-helix protein, CopG family [Acidobacteriota bacterium]